MGFQVAAIARGPEKESLAKELGAHHYIDSNAAGTSPPASGNLIARATIP